MMADLIAFPDSSAPLPPDVVLELARGKLAMVVVIGYTEDGDEYTATSEWDGAEVVFLLERAKKIVMDHHQALCDKNG